jgi:hypothetical protein
MNVYPNPTTNYLTLKVADFELSTLNFQLSTNRPKCKIALNYKVCALL